MSLKEEDEREERGGKCEGAETRGVTECVPYCHSSEEGEASSGGEDEGEHSGHAGAQSGSAGQRSVAVLCSGMGCLQSCM